MQFTYATAISPIRSARPVAASLKRPGCVWQKSCRRRGSGSIGPAGLDKSRERGVSSPMALSLGKARPMSVPKILVFAGLDPHRLVSTRGSRRSPPRSWRLPAPTSPASRSRTIRCRSTTATRKPKPARRPTRVNLKADDGGASRRVHREPGIQRLGDAAAEEHHRLDFAGARARRAAAGCLPAPRLCASAARRLRPMARCAR